MKTRRPDLAALIARLPDADRPGQASTITGPEPRLATEVASAVLAGGRDSVLELIASVREPGDEGYSDFRPAYLLRCVVLEAGAPGREDARRMVCEAIASRLEGGEASDAVRARLIRELQLAAGPEAIDKLAALLAGDLCDPAAQALAAIGSVAAPALRAALAGSGGRARLAVIQALGRVGDPGSASLLAAALAGEDRDARIAAGWALARLGDPAAAAPLLARAAAAEGWERTQEMASCLLLAENLVASGKRAEAIALWGGVRDATGDDPAWSYLREAAARGMAGSAVTGARERG